MAGRAFEKESEKETTHGCEPSSIPGAYSQKKIKAVTLYGKSHLPKMIFISIQKRLLAILLLPPPKGDVWQWPNCFDDRFEGRGERLRRSPKKETRHKDC